jgi:uncharacterized protein (DUF1778 family)
MKPKRRNQSPQPRTCRLGMRCSVIERSLIQTWAQAAGMSVGAWLWEAAAEKAELDQWCPPKKTD